MWNVLHVQGTMLDAGAGSLDPYSLRSVVGNFQQHIVIDLTFLYTMSSVWKLFSLT